MSPKPGAKEKILNLLEVSGFKPVTIAFFEPPGKIEGAVYTPSQKTAEKINAIFFIL